MGKKKRKRPQKQIAWTDTEWEIQPIMVRINIKGKKIKALVDSGANENHMHWRAAT